MIWTDIADAGRECCRTAGAWKRPPYIFTKDEIDRLIGRLDRLEPVGGSPCGSYVYPCMIRLLYGCGVQVTEALGLRRQDVDVGRGALHICGGQRRRERVIPMSATMAGYCRKYCMIMHSRTDRDCPFFYGRDGKAYSRYAVGKAFRGFCKDAGISYCGEEERPRLLDLRHTFVCHNIRQWAEDGLPVYDRLSELSGYMGLTSIRAVQRYLCLSADVYPHIRKICEQAADDLYENAACDFSQEEYEI